MPYLDETERVGTTIGGKYRIEQIIGEGGMAVVYAGTHEWTHRRVAIKLLRPEYSRDSEVVDRFLTEARAAASLDHPNVVEVLDMGADADRTVYLILELLRGQSLGARLREGGKVPAPELLALLLPVMDALALAHERKILHRDLKSDNVFLATQPDGAIVAKLLDFGIARILEGNSTRMTQAGLVLGTPQYMSPEQATGSADIGPASDLWSMGVVLYECLSGTVPFEGGTPLAVLHQVLGSEPKRLEFVAPDVPTALSGVVHRALEKRPENRYASMRAFIEELRPYAAKRVSRPPYSSAAPPAQTPAPSRPSAGGPPTRTPAAQRPIATSNATPVDTDSGSMPSESSLSLPPGARPSRKGLIATASVVGAALIVGGFAYAFLHLDAPVEPSSQTNVPLPVPASAPDNVPTATPSAATGPSPLGAAPAVPMPVAVAQPPASARIAPDEQVVDAGAQAPLPAARSTPQRRARVQAPDLPGPSPARPTPTKSTQRSRQGQGSSPELDREF